MLAEGEGVKNMKRILWLVAAAALALAPTSAAAKNGYIPMNSVSKQVKVDYR
jgi:hypothetical protein